MMKFNLKTLLVFTCLLAQNAFGNFLKEGSHLGTQNGEECIHLLLKSAPGRAGSFFGMLINNDDKISLYLIDVINQTSYAMTPLEITQDGQIGIVNDDPSLVISSSQNSKGEQIFRITNANSSNQAGHNGFFEFEGKQSEVSWTEIKSGEYKNSEKSNALQISQIDVNEKEAQASFLSTDMSGNYVIREKFPQMYLINKNTVLSTGASVSDRPTAIAVFIKKKAFLGTKSQMLLINPKSETDIKRFTLK